MNAYEALYSSHQSVKAIGKARTPHFEYIEAVGIKGSQ